jgi:oligosaccharyltransferase complex subunit delta (ribophorin II)
MLLDLPLTVSLHRLVPSQQLSETVSLGSADTLKVTLTAQEGKTAKRPHQAFLLLQDQERRLDVSYPFSVKESGKAVVSLVSHVQLDKKEEERRRRENIRATAMRGSQSNPCFHGGNTQDILDTYISHAPSPVRPCPYR